MICPNCGIRNDSDARFCKKCGTNLHYAEFLEYGGFWRRFFAAIIDDLLFTSLYICIFFVLKLPSLAVWILVFMRWMYFAGMESSS